MPRTMREDLNSLSPICHLAQVSWRSGIYHVLVIRLKSYDDIIIFHLLSIDLGVISRLKILQLHLIPRKPGGRIVE